LYAIARELKVNIIDFFQESVFEYDLFKAPAYKNIICKNKERDNKLKFFIGDSTDFENIEIFSYLTLYTYKAKPVYQQHNGWELIILHSGKLKILLLHENTTDKKEIILENPFDVLLFNAKLFHACTPV
jgi:hypothetical protein